LLLPWHLLRILSRCNFSLNQDKPLKVDESLLAHQKLPGMEYIELVVKQTAACKILIKIEFYSVLKHFSDLNLKFSKLEISIDTF